MRRFQKGGNGGGIHIHSLGSSLGPAWGCGGRMQHPDKEGVSYGSSEHSILLICWSIVLPILYQLPYFRCKTEPWKES